MPFDLMFIQQFIFLKTLQTYSHVISLGPVIIYVEGGGGGEIYFLI